MYRIHCLSHVVTEKNCQTVFQRGFCMHPTSILNMFLYDSLLSAYPQWPGVYFNRYQLWMALFALAFLDNSSTNSLWNMHFLEKRFYLLLAVLHLRVWAFLYFWWAWAITSGVRVSHCSVSSCWGAPAHGLQWLQHVNSASWLPGSRAQARHLWHMGSIGCGIFPS